MTALPAFAVRRRSLFGHPVFVAFIALAIVGFVRLWLDSGGRLVVWPSHTVYYEVLADAFMHHQVSLRIQPRAELAALPDPYDPAANLPYRWHDVAYYDGKYYLPWGPAPALIARRADHFRAHLLIESGARSSLQQFLKRWLPQVEALPRPTGLRWSIDVDPLEVD